MHEFTELIHRCTHFSLNSLDRVNEGIIKDLQNSGATTLVKSLQMVSLNKVVLAVGMFSIFEAHLQDNLNCEKGFSEAKKILDEAGENEIKDCFSNLILAINILKHGKGRSYNTLVNKADELSFRLKMPNETFFDEGDLSEISTLIEVDNDFVELCSKSIDDVSNIVRKNHPDFY
jgi:hypothetical protein